MKETGFDLFPGSSVAFSRDFFPPFFRYVHTDQMMALDQARATALLRLPRRGLVLGGGEPAHDRSNPEKLQWK
jgi:hypothetical protein